MVSGFRGITHLVSIGDSEVVKRYRSWDHDEHRREWLALTLLATHAPGLAPVPISASLDSDPPSVRMSRVPGQPLTDHVLDSQRLDALAAAVNRLHSCVPADAVSGVDQQPWLADGAQARLRSMSRGLRLGDSAVVSAAIRWIDQADHPPGSEVLFFRRAFAIFWLFLLGRRSDGLAAQREQGDRLLALLG